MLAPMRDTPSPAGSWDFVATQGRKPTSKWVALFVLVPPVPWI